MKKTLITLAVAIALAGAGLNRAVAFGTGDNAIRTTVIFSAPEKFTDVGNSFHSDRDRDATLAELKSYLIRRAGAFVSLGEKLTITVTDVDLAGDFEPWRGPQYDDVRIVRDIYPPRIDLTFQLTDADGKVVKEGKRELRDLAFMMKLSIDQNDPLRFEKNLLDDWLREEFRSLKKAD